MNRVLLAATLLAVMPPQPAAADEAQSMAVGGVSRSYVVHEPSSEAGGPRAAVLIFHGGGGRGAGMERLTHFDAVADREGFVAVYPDGIDHHWNDGRNVPGKSEYDDVAFTGALIDRLVRDDHVDPKRVYATGISNGGFFTFRLACTMADRFAAVATVAATMPLGLAGCRPARAIPIAMFEGTDDPLVPYGGGTVGSRYGANLGAITSMDATFAQWMALDRCGAQRHSSALAGSYAEPITLITACAGMLSLYRIEGRGHTWPGGPQNLPPSIVGTVASDFDASSAMWSFFSRLVLP